MQKDDGGAAARGRIEPHDVFGQAFYPLTLPLTVGPGSSSVAIILCANLTHRYAFYALNILAAVIAMCVIALSVYICFGFSDRLARMLGKTGLTFITWLTGFLLVCIRVQITWNGLSALLSSLT